MSPRNAPGSCGPTASPKPRATAGPVALHSTRMSTNAGVSLGPKNWNESITAKSLRRTVARRSDILKSRLARDTSSVQNRPDGRIPPLKSCSCDPAPGSKTSIQTKANAPRCTLSSTTYSPSNARMSVSRLYVLPSLPRSFPHRNCDHAPHP